MEPTREIYWNIVGGKLIYIFALAALGVMVWGIRARVLLWRRGAQDPRAELPAEALPSEDLSDDSPDEPTNPGSTT